MKVAFLPVYPNPYQRLLRDSLEACDVSVEFLESLPDNDWLADHRSDVDILHFHWLDGLYMRRFATPWQALKFINFVHRAKRLGYRIVWTAHNILPHRSRFRPLDIQIRKMMMREAHAVIVHCDAGARELLRLFPRDGLLAVIQIGNYLNVYPLTITREAARASFGFDEKQFVYLALGNIVAYKGLGQFIEAFSHIACENDIAVIAGRGRDKKVLKHIQAAASNDPRIILFDGFVPNNEMQRYLLSADVMVAPFEKVLTSSSVIVGLSYGLPIIVPDLGCLPELITEDAGLVYRANNTAELSHALVEIRDHDLQAMGSAGKMIAEKLDWADIGRKTVALYEEILNP